MSAGDDASDYALDYVKDETIEDVPRMTSMGNEYIVLAGYLRTLYFKNNKSKFQCNFLCRITSLSAGSAFTNLYKDIHSTEFRYQVTSGSMEECYSKLDRFIDNKLKNYNIFDPESNKDQV